MLAFMGTGENRWNKIVILRRNCKLELKNPTGAQKKQGIVLI